MPTNQEVAPAFRKLTRESVPVKVLKNPFQLTQVRADLERMREALKAKTESTVMAFFHKRSTADAPIKIQIEALEMREAALASEMIEAVLTPLTEAEVWEVRVEYGAIYNTLLKKVENYEGEAKQAFMDEVKSSSTKIWVSKWIEIALKKPEQEGGKWIRYAGPGKLMGIDPPTLDWLFNFYHESFTLSDDELKKFAAPTKAAS